VHLTYFYRLGYLYTENCQICLRFDEVLTKTSWVIFGTPCTYTWREFSYMPVHLQLATFFENPGTFCW